MFGQIKQARGFRQFLLRGVEKVANEWGLVCLAHNILKLAQGRTRPLPHSNRLSFATSETVQRTMAAKLRPNLTSNWMREFAASGSPTGLSGSNPSSPGLSRQAPRSGSSSDGGPIRERFLRRSASRATSAPKIGGSNGPRAALAGLVRRQRSFDNQATNSRRTDRQSLCRLVKRDLSSLGTFALSIDDNVVILA